jgi:hypothetical protein
MVGAVRTRDFQAMAGVAAVIAAVLVGWTLRDVLAPTPRRAPRDSGRPSAPVASASPAPAPLPVPVPGGGDSPGQVSPSVVPPSNEGGGGADLDAEQRRAAEKLQRRMKRFLSDLEYSPGLPEPPQQVIAPVPPPWAPDPAAAGLPEPAIDAVSPRAGVQGAHVRIAGKNLRAMQVMFGDHPAEIVSDAESELTVLAPGGHGVVSVVVTNVDGQYAIATDAFTYR